MFEPAYLLNASGGPPDGLPLAQAAPGFMADLLGADAANFVLNLGISVVILIAGWIAGLILASGLRRFLKKFDFDNRIANWATGRPAKGQSFPVENWIANGAFWLVMLFAILIALDRLGLQSASTPLQGFLGSIFNYAPRLVSALVLGAIAWGMATLVKLVFTRLLKRFQVDDLLAQEMATDGSGAPAIPLNETLGNILYWLILLLFLPFVLDALQLQGPLAPIQATIAQVLSALPRIGKAIAIGFGGWLVARVVRSIASNFLSSVGVDRVGHRLGLSRLTGSQSVSWLIGTLVYTVILVVTAISVLQELQIAAISDPAIATLQEVLLAIPYILRAAAILIVAYLVGRFVSDLVVNVLSGMGFNNIFRALGLPQPTYSARTPSEVAGAVALVGVMLFAAVAAIDSLRVPELTALVAALIAILGQVLVGVLVFAVGLYLANLSFRLIAMTGTGQANFLAQAARVAIIALSGAMALQQMGIATDIVNLAFGLLLGAVAVAVAIAFGLGGRDLAAEQMRQWLDTFNRKD